MKWSTWLEERGMTGLKIKTRYLEMDFKPADQDRAAAWELYIELLTRTATQELGEDDGVEKTALESVYA